MVFIFLLCLTVYFQLIYERVEVSGPELVRPDFLEIYRVADATQGMRDKATARLVNNVPGESVIVAQPIEPHSGIRDVRVSVEASAADISAGDKPWHGGRVVLTAISEATNRVLPT